MPLGINELEILSEPVEEDIYIVDKILPPGVTLLCGYQKIGKSWLALKLCLCATRGVDLWGYLEMEHGRYWLRMITRKGDYNLYLHVLSNVAMEEAADEKS